MILIKLLDGETIRTEQYTKPEAEAAVAAGSLELGGVHDDFADDEDAVVPRRRMYAAAVASIAEVAA